MVEENDSYRDDSEQEIGQAPVTAGDTREKTGVPLEVKQVSANPAPIEASQDAVRAFGKLVTNDATVEPDSKSTRNIDEGGSSVEVSTSTLKAVYDFTIDIIDKQYRSYTWNDGKVQALVTIDTALIAGILLVLQIFTHVGVVVFLLFGCSFLSLLISFVICLVHAIPKIHSGVGNEDNLRTMVGITPLSKTEYHKRMTTLRMPDMIRMNCWQIAGMCKNNIRSYKLIKHGVHLTIVGVLAIGVALPLLVYSNRAHGEMQSVSGAATENELDTLISRPVPGSPLPEKTQAVPVRIRGTSGIDSKPIKVLDSSKTDTLARGSSKE